MKMWAWAILLMGAGLLSCSKSANSSEDATVAWIQIRDWKHNTPSAYMVSVGDQKIYCGVDDTLTSKQIHCSSEGVALSFRPESPVHILVKAPQRKFYDTTVSFGDQDTLRVPMDSLPTFIHNEDQATGFLSQTGLSQFLTMSYHATSELGDCYSLKFIITNLDSQPVVHFQNTNKFKLHYAFAKQVLGDTRTVDEFENDTYYSAHRSAIAGTLVYYPSIDSGIGVTFFPSDLIDTKLILLAHRLIEERMQFLTLMGTKNRLYYLPAGSNSEQEATAHIADFAFQDAPLKFHSELFSGIKLQILNPGLAYGILRRLTPEQLQTTVLSAHDIVILTQLPAQLQLVAGTITEELQTPLSHVNLAACARNTPNVAFNGAIVPDSILNLQDSLVKFEVSSSGYTLTKTTFAEAQKYWQTRAGDTIHLTSDVSDSTLHDFASIGFTYSNRVGVKAANLAEMHHVIPDNSPDGFAIPFYYYDQFLATAMVTDSLCNLARNNCEKDGRAASLCTQVQQTCTNHQSSEVLRNYLSRIIARSDFSTDSQLREATLDGIRYMMRHIPIPTAFATRLDSQVYAWFDTATVHLRSSTNSEDLDDFNGAGLYDSEGASPMPGNLPSEEIRKVWASVWNWRAYEERSWWNIDQLSVKMGVAVHKSFPSELANGVVLSQNIADLSTAGIYANIQMGEASITNPTGDARPEIISIVPTLAGKVQAVSLQYSSLSPGSAILSEAETLQLYNLVALVQTHFATLYQQSPNSMILDIEFKLMGPDRHLVFKQARPYLP